MAIREGRWMCPNCDAEQLGRHQKCQSCAAPKPIGIKHYLPEDAPAVTDPGQLARARAGADRLCEYCQARLSASVTVCTNCGASLDCAPRATTHDYKPGEVPRSHFTAEVERGREQLEHTFGPASSSVRLSASPAAPARRRWLKPVIGSSALIAVILGWLTFSTKPVELTVQALNWERSIAVEDERTVSEEDWSVPVGGRQTDSFRAIHHYDQVLDHYDTKSRQVCNQVQSGTESYSCGTRDLGNGYFEDITCTRPTYTTECHDETYQDPVYRDEPRYATKYRYDIERWFVNRTERAAGTGSSPKWPAYTLGARERAGARTENYRVSFNGLERAHEFTVTLAQLQALETGARCIGRINFFGAVNAFPDCSGNVEQP